ncbi:desulfoferrodoxin [Methanoplanus sp. FWC-SCC4]|uniref:Desulfoferrodoxin n=1 Tax=Methanochimaera problematica TaxID=2609417 RepID=A0AA97FDQ9_9EURY|nr:desulfoferrodoxin [Methanoplanus sp. FWC-SCC4]WOF15576.1 desulfoferrodoxin [Methanoplanus sp. FWC-SCC4]
MTKTRDVYKCENCGNVVFVADAGEGELVCCGEPMVRLIAKTADFKTEKHVPVVEKTDSGIKVTVGSTPHPMTEEHHIVMIAVCEGNEMMVHWLNPGDEPVAEFSCTDAGVRACEYCNVHGLWTNKN